MHRTATALSSWVKAIRRALEATGIAAAPLLLQAGLDPEQLDQPNARYPVENTTRLWQLAVEATGNPAFGLVVARHISQTTFHALGYSIVASNSLRDAFERMVRYFHIVTDAAELQFENSAAGYRFLIRVDPQQAQPADAAIDAFMLVIVRLCRALHSRGVAPLLVSLCRAAPDHGEEFSRAFRCPVHFDAAENLLLFDHALFDAPLEGANPELAQHNDDVVRRYLEQHQLSSLRHKVHGAIIQHLSQGEPSQEKIAEALHMSLRNLQRRLAEENSSYKDLLNQARRELALSYLQDGRYSIGEITFLLGFADTSSFTRAFKRWTGTTPSAATR